MSLEDRISALERAVVELLSRVAQDRTPERTIPVPSVDPPVQPAAVQPVDGAAVLLRTFMAQAVDLTIQERIAVANAATRMVQELFVHLPLKKAMYGIDPLQRLKLLQRRLESEARGDRPESTEISFHLELIEIFHSLRDLHTNYILPASYQGRTAYLPFLVQEYIEVAPKKIRKYIVTRVVAGEVPAKFEREVLITSWNGIPIERAIELNAAREAGSNEDARHARGLDALTLRPLALSGPPDESWVSVGYESKTGEKLEARFDWKVTTDPSSVMGVDADIGGILGGVGDVGQLLGFDSAAVALQRSKRALFFPEQVHAARRMAAALAQSAAPAAGQAAAEDDFFAAAAPGQQASRVARQFRQAPRPPRFDSYEAAAAGLNTAASVVAASAVAADDPTVASMMPEVFSFRKFAHQGRTIGYIRIFTFMVQDANAFVAEFVRILTVLNVDRLVLDVRGNGGGNILAGEQLLQVLTKEKIEPQRFHFINTPATLKLCKTQTGLKRWIESIDASIVSSETFSQGFRLTDINAANSVGQKFSGKVVLLIDALCYSTTDIFSAGFQDHGIGTILGVHSRTGAGGANVWPYGFFQQYLGYPALPKGVTFRSAIRRSTRVGNMAGVILEDFGVKADLTHDLTRNDVLNSNADLLSRAASLLA